jgi:hypothetical protein
LTHLAVERVVCLRPQPDVLVVPNPAADRLGQLF